MATENTLRRDHAGGAGGLVFRPDARPHPVLVTDEDADHPFYPANQFLGQTALEPRASGSGVDWQAEIDATARAIIMKRTFVTLIMQLQDGLAVRQYGDPAQDASAPDSQQFEPAATLAKLHTSNARDSLVAQMLAAGLTGRVFDIRGLHDPAVVTTIFRVVIEAGKLRPLPLRRTKDWLEVLMETTTLIATFGLLAFMIERLTNGVAIVLG
jgi:hypothetical protein